MANTTYVDEVDTSLAKAVAKFKDHDFQLIYRAIEPRGTRDPIQRLESIRFDISQVITDLGRLIALPSIGTKLNLSEYLHIVNEEISDLNELSVGTPSDVDNMLAEISSFYMNFYGLKNASVSSTLYGGSQICNSILTLLHDDAKIAGLISELEIAKQIAETTFQTANSTIEELNKKALEETSRDYSVMFGKQANRNMGAAITWLVVGVICLVIFGMFVINIEDILPLSSSTNNTVVILSYIKRLLIISFLIYIISFVFKQYNISRHLQTVNIHRKLTLNSYKLFIASIPESSSDTRELLIKEIAKCIYESGQTGYLNFKDAPESNTLITEITKIIKDKSPI